MSSKIQAVRGTQDMVGEDAARFDQVIETFTRVRKLYGFRPVHVPVFEFTGVFARSLGETTDVVSKEMYTFEDRGGESLTLRPEFTAGIARAYISNGWQQHAPMKLAAWGPAFRYERPQKGRFRQFHQLDAEILGSGEPAADVEIIALAQHVLDALGLQGKTVLNLNTLGDPETRAAWQAALIAHFSAHRDALSAESRERLEKNPLRILDSKDAADKALVADAPRIDAYMSAEAGAWFDAVRKGLDAAGVAYQRNEALVRGLDYYRHTTFEFITEHLGAQGTVLGGGRYDGLMEALGGPHTPCVGWAAGIERLAMLLDAPAAETIDAAVVPMGAAAEAKAFEVLQALRRAGLAAEQTWRGNMKKRMQKADAAGARYAVIIGDDELAAGEATVKRLATGEQWRVALDALAETLLGALR
ncbi:histidine--tRNA ligase [Sphingosinicella microcystinivorans]|uniref:histidine--tRNA ligase n=1 Tax=Sphingosinicella microcystinivorans TaxID=335406 RepID=UPI0022F394DF|nr:histidine--tRNA ligase [Sphingosinicella microcystinivorans]WBX85253.1 histidine--tRNA ligase [Sphingosinicella microcystinivorans]